MTDRLGTYRAVEALDGVFTLVDKQFTAPDPGQVRIAVEACGICHSDEAGVHNLLGALPPGTPIVPGHEIVGRVDAIGDGVTGWQVGDRVGVGFHAGPCRSARTAAAATSSSAPTSRSPGSASTAGTPST